MENKSHVSNHQPAIHSPVGRWMFRCSTNTSNHRLSTSRSGQAASFVGRDRNRDFRVRLSGECYDHLISEGRIRYTPQVSADPWRFHQIPLEEETCFTRLFHLGLNCRPWTSCRNDSEVATHPKENNGMFEVGPTVGCHPKWEVV